MNYFIYRSEHEWLGHSGLAMYDNTARLHDPLLMRFCSPDPLYAKFGPLSPWSHCAADPLNHFDPDGRILLNDDGSIHLRPTSQLSAHFDNQFLAAPCRGFTSKGTPITIYTNLSEDKGYDTNCHGFALLNSQGSLQDDASLEAILNDEYEVIDESNVQPGDIVTYEVSPTQEERTELGIQRELTFAHTAVIESVDNGHITEISNMRNNTAITSQSHKTTVEDYKNRDILLIKYYRKVIPDCTQFYTPETSDK